MPQCWAHSSQTPARRHPDASPPQKRAAPSLTRPAVGCQLRPLLRQRGGGWVGWSVTRGCGGGRAAGGRLARPKPRTAPPSRLFPQNVGDRALRPPLQLVQAGLQVAFQIPGRFLGSDRGEHVLREGGGGVDTAGRPSLLRPPPASAAAARATLQCARPMLPPKPPHIPTPPTPPLPRRARRAARPGPQAQAQTRAPARARPRCAR